MVLAQSHGEFSTHPGEPRRRVVKSQDRQSAWHHGAADPLGLTGRESDAALKTHYGYKSVNSASQRSLAQETRLSAQQISSEI
jgi:hypothetical protein